MFYITSLDDNSACTILHSRVVCTSYAARCSTSTQLTIARSYRIVIGIVVIIYFLIGIEISRLRDEFKLTEDDHIALTSHSTSSRPFDNNDSTVTTIVESDVNNKPGLVPESHIISESSLERTSTLRQLSRHFGSNNQSPPTQRRMSFKQYILMPSLFFLALLTTWVAPTINRVSLFIQPDHHSYPLFLAVSALGSLRGFWNGIIFMTMGMKGWKRRAIERRGLRKPVS